MAGLSALSNNTRSGFRRIRPLIQVCLVLGVLTGCGGGSSGGGSGSGNTPQPTVNTAPVASAGVNQNVETGSEVTLDGSASSDADGDALSFSWSFDSIPDASAVSLTGGNSESASFTTDADGTYVVSLTVNDGTEDSGADSVTITSTTASDPGENPGLTYAIVDTAQTNCYSSTTGQATACTGVGHDADYAGSQPDYTVSDDELTVADNVTGLTWQQSSDTNGDGQLDYADKLFQSEAVTYCQDLDLGQRQDWRLPSIKEAYSLILFSGKDASSYQGNDTSTLTPFLDAKFDWAFGDTVTAEGIAAGDRIIDGQYASSTLYVSTTMNGDPTMFGVNFVDGRIKGYPSDRKEYYVRCVAGNTDYGINDFTDNQDQTISDEATGLMWQQDDTDSTDWDDAVSQCEQATTASFDDWRLPNVKELQSIIDYTRSPATDNEAAIDPVFNSTSLQNEEGVTDWGYYWASTTHVDNDGDGSNATYVSFGRALGYMQSSILDVHGAGAQRSNDKLNVATEPGAQSATGANGTFYYKGPQGDILRANNKTRCVRDITSTATAKIPTNGTTNILLIVGDDIGVDNVSGYGEQPNYSAQTPSIDDLATDGVLFRNVWANPLCSPSRASILTGRHAFRHGVTHPAGLIGVLDSAEETVAEALSTVGYETALFGKWHLGATAGNYPTDQGFGYFSGSLANLADYFDWEKTRITEEFGTATTVSEQAYATEVVAEEALAWIDQATGPWFVEVAFNAPHDPYHVPPASTYESVVLDGSVGDACSSSAADDDIPDCFRAAAEAMDTYIGYLLDNIDPEVLANTLIIFVGDNGTPRQAIIAEEGLPFSPSHGKATVYEGGINVPLIISAGSDVGIDAAEITDMVQVQDLFSTMLELAGTTTSVGGAIDGQSLIGYLDAETSLPVARTQLYSELFSESQDIDLWAITDGAAKYLYNQGDDECYDLDTDPGETENEYLGTGEIRTTCDSLKSDRPQ